MKYKDKNTQKLGIKYQERTDDYQQRYGYNYNWNNYSSTPQVSLRDFYIFRCSNKIKDHGWWRSLSDDDQKRVFLKSKKHTMDELMDMFPGDINKKRNGRIDEILR